MPFVVYFYIYSGAAFVVLIVALCWGNEHKVNAASLLLASVMLTNIFQQLVVLDLITKSILNHIYALIDLFLLWVFVGIARRPAAYERNNWAVALATIQFCMLSVNLVVSNYPSLTRAYVFMVGLNGLMIAALATCLISFMPKSWDEATGVLKVKWLYFKADIFDRLLRVSGKKTVASAAGGGARPLVGALNGKIGGRIREARLKRGVSLDALACFLGATTNEAQTYEAGGRRLPATALHALAKHLCTRTKFFHQGIGVAAPAFTEMRAARR